MANQLCGLSFIKSKTPYCFLASYYAGVQVNFSNTPFCYSVRTTGVLHRIDPSHTLRCKFIAPLLAALSVSFHVIFEGSASRLNTDRMHRFYTFLVDEASRLPFTTSGLLFALKLVRLHTITIQIPSDCYRLLSKLLETFYQSNSRPF